MRETIAAALEEHRRVVEGLLATFMGSIEEAARRIIASYRAGGKVLIMGNGGSAADSQHFAAELVGRYKRERRALPAIALTTDTSALTAVANDYGYAQVFARQVRAHARKGDIVVGISTSGNSENVVRAFAQAKALELRTVSLTGESGGALGPMADIEIKVPSSETSHIQEAHIAVGQLIAFLVEDELYPRG